MKKGKIIAGVTAVLIGSVSPVFFCDTDVVSCEKVYDVNLKIETVNVDINNIPSDRKIQVPVYIENNPGFIVMFLAVKRDLRLGYDQFSMSEYNHDIFSVASSIPNEWEEVIAYDIGENDISKLYSDNGTLLTLDFILPENISPGDFYSLEFSDNFSGRERPCFFQENSFDGNFGRDNFGSLTSGGIRITGQQEAPAQEPAQEPTQEPSQAPQENKPSGDSSQNNSPAGQNNNSNNNNGSSNNSSGKKEEQTTGISEIVTGFVTSETTDEITAFTEVSAVTEVSTGHSTTCGEITSAVASETEINKQEQKKNNTGVLAAVIGAAAVTATAITAAVRKKKEKNRSDR